MLKQVVASALFGWAVITGGAALADGMPGSVKDTPDCCVAPIWSGFYLGAGIGYGHLVAENNYWEPTFSSDWHGEGGAGGFGTAVVGYDRQIRDRYVIGGFLEYDWSSLEITYEDTNTPLQKFRMRDAFSLGGRAGFLMTPSSLLYLTGGYTWGRGKSDQYFDIQSGSTTYSGVTSLDLNGPFVGVGMETMLTSRLALRGEVRYTMFDDVVTNRDASTPFTNSFGADLLTGRLVLTYKFNGNDGHARMLK